MKINIITYYWSNNIGALIQSLCLREFLRKNFDADVQYNKYLPKNLVLRERMSQINRKNFYFLLEILRKKINLYFWKKNIANLENPNQILELFNKDLYIYGSDEIWNYTNPFFGFDSYFFGDFNNKSKIAYGCSIGNAELEINSQSKRKKMKECLKNFKAISVRDENSSHFIEKLLNIRPEIVLDPCFLASPKMIDGENSNFYNKFSKKKFILIYGDYFSRAEINKIIHFSKKNKLDTISVSFVNKWSDFNILKINPNDLIFFVKNSEFIITSMFHGVMLAYKYQKQFWYSEDPYRKNKLYYFLKKLNLIKQHVDYIGINEIDYKFNDKEFKIWKKKSEEFIINNISKNNLS